MDAASIHPEIGSAESGQSYRGGGSIVIGKLTSIGRKPLAPMPKLHGVAKPISPSSINSVRQHKSRRSMCFENSLPIATKSAWNWVGQSTMIRERVCQRTQLESQRCWVASRSPSPLHPPVVSSSPRHFFAPLFGEIFPLFVLSGT